MSRTEPEILRVRVGSFKSVVRCNFTLIQIPVDHPEYDAVEFALSPSMAQRLADSLAERPPESKS